MPEGDTIFRAARTLHRALANQTVIAFESVLPKLERVEVDDHGEGLAARDQVHAAGHWRLAGGRGGQVG